MDSPASGDPVEGHTLRSTDYLLGELRLHVLSLGSLAIEHLHAGSEALVSASESAAARLLDEEDSSRAQAAHVTRLAFEVLALRQMVAIDLRFVVAVQRIVVDIERIGHEGRKLALIARRLAGREEARPVRLVRKHLSRMAALVGGMVRDALRALDEADLERSLAVVHRDQEVDQTFSETLRLLLTHAMAGEGSPAFLIDTVLAARGLERAGDHARSVAEQVHYFLLGELPARPIKP
jgi:phosphate transport system protein